MAIMGSEYFLARLRNDKTRAITLARTVGEHLVAMGQFEAYVGNLDWHRNLQREDPDLAMRFYEKRCAGPGDKFADRTRARYCLSY